MANFSASGAVCWEAEASWGEDVTTFATDRVAVLESVDISGLGQDVLEPGKVNQYRNEGQLYIRGPMNASFKTKVYLNGHGSTMVGSPTIGAHENFLALVAGSAAALSATASTTLTGGTAAVPTTTASGTFSAGGLCRIGALGDGDGDGQFYAITTHTTTSLTLRGALRGAPVNGAVLYPVVQIIGPEAPTSTAITGTRFLLQTANLCIEAHGCFPMSYTITGTNPGELPMAEITWGCSWWRYSTATFPTTTASAALTMNPGPVCAGSWNVNTSGTTTRSERSYRSLSINVTLGVEPVMGPGGVNAYQKIIGARRKPDTIEIEWVEDADAATTTPVLPGLLTAGAFLHGELTLNTADGAAVGFAFPRMCVVNMPTQAAVSNRNAITIRCRAHTSAVTTSNLTLAAMVMGSA